MILKRYGAGLILTFMILFLLTAMLLLSFQDGPFDGGVFLWGVILAAVIVLQYNILSAVFKHIDRITLLIADFLCIIGFVMLYRMNPEAGERQFMWIVVGNIAMVAALIIIKRVRDFGRANWWFMLLGILLLGITLVLSTSQLGANNWLKIGPFKFQPSEFVKVLFLIVTAYFLSTRQRKRDMWPYFLFTIACVGILVLSTDLGAALLFAGTFLIVFYVGTGNLGITLLSIGAFAGGAYASYYLFDHVKTRVEIWQDPWAAYEGKGYQIVQGLLAIASGGVLGTGLGNGMPTSIPVHETDYIFAAIAEEFGLIVAVALIAFYLVFIVRGILIAMDARAKFDKLLVFGSTCMLALQSFIIIGGVIKLIPLTGITMPFVSLGGSSMISSMMLLGIIEGVAQKNGELDEAELAEMGGGIE
ncbi:FtsW/RodA/SpoVE family cell cycle protein [Christensenellaceae bacterium OttesenSCG-928-K19]|nr:FtsW/RodA/SpoVE family cell cycle protein [Christensenellaceae bacterium OttesenSCG-928-K19]